VQLKGLTKLEYLYLKGSQITDARFGVLLVSWLLRHYQVIW